MVPRRASLTLRSVVGRVARLAPPRHRELVRGMLAELDSIGDPGERVRFAWGAIAAIARLSVSGLARDAVHALGRLVGAGALQDETGSGGPFMSKLTSGQLLRRLAVPFVVAFACLTIVLLASSAARWVPLLSARGVTVPGIAGALLVAVPHTVALTIPMAVFLAVSWAFMRLGREGVVAAARGERRGVRRLVVPVLGAAAVLSALTFISNAEVVPRANARLAAAIQGAPPGPSDRTMTWGELRAAAKGAQAAEGPTAAARAAAYEVEIQKKGALAVASILLALLGAATAIRFPRGDRRLVFGTAAGVFTGYYVVTVAGESLADRQMLSPFVAMWTANAILLVAAALLVWRPSRPRPTRGPENLAAHRP